MTKMSTVTHIQETTTTTTEDSGDVIPPQSQKDEKDSWNNELEQPCAKYTNTQRVYAKDNLSGLLYEAVVRRSMFGVQHQRQLKICQVESEQDVEHFLQQQPDPPTWHYFVHYSGWNVKWDRWVTEQHLYSVTHSTKRFAQRISEEIKAVKERLKGQKIHSVKMAAELEQIMVMLEQEKRMEERQEEELAKHNVFANSDKQPEMSDNHTSKTKKQAEWTKSHLTSEYKLKEQQLQGRRNHTQAHLLILPLALKKIMVEEWEIITQCGMIPNFPAKLSIKDALDQYLTSKLKLLDNINDNNDSGTISKVDDNDDDVDPNQEWRQMVDGILLFFDQGIPDRLLYSQELTQYSEQHIHEKRNCELYGCEVLLRMFVRLPSIVAEGLSEAEMRPILSKCNDLVRFLLKYQGTLFTQTYQKPTQDKVVTKKRKLVTTELTSNTKQALIS